MKRIFLLMIAGGFLMFSSCTKSGPTGPQGPAGQNGNANVVGSDPFTVSTWTYTSSGTAGYGYYSATFTDQDITTSVADRGVVEIFKEYGTEWTNLPDINGNTSTVFNFYAGGFTIYIQNADGTNPASPGTVIFRTVVISPSNRLAHPNTNWKNYTEAMAAINADKAAASVSKQ